MSEVLCSAPIAVPVFRMRATLACRDLGSPAHRAAERLRELGVPTDWIAATLGLRIDQAENLLGQLDGSGGQGVREILVWIDLPHGAVLTANQGLDLITGQRQRNLALLPVLPPTASDLEPAAFTAAASTLSGRSARIVVDEVRALVSDHRPSRQFDHVLHLARCDLVIHDDRTVEIHWHDVVDERLTTFARDVLSDELLEVDWERLTALAAEEERASTLARSGMSLLEAYAIDLDPGTIHDRALALVQSAESQVVLVVDAPLSGLPDWLEPALDAARERDVNVYLLLSSTSRWKGRRVARWPATRVDNPPAGVLLVRDGDRALVHSAPLAFGAEAAMAGLRSQAALEVHDAAAVRALLERLQLPSPTVASRASDRAVEDVAVEQLRQTIGHQQRHRGTLSVAITSDDIGAFVEQVARNHVHLRDRRRIGQLAAGVVWERAVHATCVELADQHPQLVVDALRWAPPEGGMDLDIILRDLDARTWWVLDAKYDAPGGRHVAHVLLQLRIAYDHGLVPDEWTARALIVYPPNPRGVPELTNDARVRRATLDRLPEALELV